MNYVRLYTGDDGLSHFEDVEVDLTERGRGSMTSLPMAAKAVVFRRTLADYDLDWHPAPRRQFVVNLEGWVEIEASNGEVRRLGPGSVMLADDTSGKGHKSRAVEGGERFSLFIHLAD